MAEDARGAGQHLEGARAGRRFGLGEGLAIAVVVLADEGREIAADAGPRLARPRDQRVSPLRPALDGLHEMRRAEPVGERVRRAQRLVVGEGEQRV